MQFKATLTETNMRKTIFAAVATLALGGCSLTLPVQGQMTDGSDRFTGTATGYLDGSGDLQIVADSGTTCTGDFVYVNDRQGEGVFTCDDGRSGPFQFVSSGSRGTGTGVLSGQPLTFTFGE